LLPKWIEPFWSIRNWFNDRQNGLSELFGCESLKQIEPKIKQADRVVEIVEKTQLHMHSEIDHT
jgi:hypothetical protein